MAALLGAVATMLGGAVVAAGIVAVVTGRPLNVERWGTRSGDTPDSGAPILDPPD